MEANFSSAMCLQIDQVILMHEWIYFNGRSVVLSVLILMNLISVASVFSKVRYYWHSNVYDRFSFPNSSDVHFVLTYFFVSWIIIKISEWLFYVVWCIFKYRITMKGEFWNLSIRIKFGKIFAISCNELTWCSWKI